MVLHVIWSFALHLRLPLVDIIRALKQGHLARSTRLCAGAVKVDTLSVPRWHVQQLPPHQL